MSICLRATFSYLALAGSITIASAQNASTDQWQGPARAELKSFMLRQKAIVDIPARIAFYGDFDGDGQEDALLFMYIPIEGAASGVDLDVALFRGNAGRYKFFRKVPEIFGQSPHNVSFTNGKIDLTMKVPRQGDAHCCPTGSKSFTIRTK